MGREAGSCSPHCPGISAPRPPHALPVCGLLGQLPFLEAGAGRGTPTGLSFPFQFWDSGAELAGLGVWEVTKGWNHMENTLECGAGLVLWLVEGE